MIGIISDIHGNYPALEAVIEELDKYGCDEIYCLGDVCGYYCMVNECIDLLRERNITTIRGNHDSYLLGESLCPRSNTVNLCIKYQKSVIKEENYQWIKGLPLYLNENKFCAVHGGWDDYLDEYIEDFNFNDEKIMKFNKNIFFSGHTHIQKLQFQNQMTYCNPGSVGQPRDYISSAAFAVLDHEKIRMKRKEYDIDRIKYAMIQEGFDEYFYSNLYRGCRIGEKSGAEKSV
ncbi:metallophosphoesterase family protein [Qiania dongpingensis]|uniref:Metallophosphoesterase family protein n=1 Tax=Qiania dongpingensis TaxID=2763669 RepID=A0A7G9G7S0_9FIRM|nr:metallophosphoesterase family protein [Qiania dongpingensis]QNM06852.1 metallophosphoesterase family protein [Qiania dongpingensis]